MSNQEQPQGGAGGSSVVVMPPITTDFLADSWVMIYGNPLEASLTPDANGGIRIQGLIPFDSSVHRNFAGVATRGRFFPDPTGRAKFRVTYSDFRNPTDFDNNNRQFLYVVLCYLDLGGDSSGNFGFAFGKKASFGQIAYEQIRRHFDGQVSAIVAGPTFAVVDGGDVTLEFTLEFINYLGTRNFAVNGFRADYTIGPLAWVVPNPGWFPQAQSHGFKIFLGLCQTDATNVGAATLSSFEVVNGVYAEPF